MSSPGLLPTIAVALLVGTLIGAIGVGGVLLAPWLVHAAGLPVQQAAAVSMLAFVGSGLAALAAARRTRGARVDRVLLAATVPGAIAGAAALAVVPERAALVVLAAAVGWAGLRLLADARPREPSVEPATAEARAATRVGGSAHIAVAPRGHAGARVGGAAVGAITGFASALTATGGPMVLTPLAVLRGMPMPDAVRLGQLVQLPIALTATAGHLAAGPVDVAAGATIGALLVPGVLLGHRLGPALPRRTLARLLGAVLLASAALFVARAFR